LIASQRIELTVASEAGPGVEGKSRALGGSTEVVADYRGWSG